MQAALEAIAMAPLRRAHKWKAEKYRSRWQELGKISQLYEYTRSRTCMCIILLKEVALILTIDFGRSVFFR